MRNPFLFLLFLFLPSFVNAALQCEDGQPPSTTNPDREYKYTYNGVTKNFTDPQAGCDSALLDLYGAAVASQRTYSHIAVGGQCYHIYNPSGTVTNLANLVVINNCPTGYTYTSPLCYLTNPSQAQCPANCSAGKPLGFATSDTASGHACVDGCEAGFQGLSAAQKDAVDGHIGDYTGMLEQTGVSCSDLPAPIPPPPVTPPNPYGSNCITNGTNTLCLKKEEPGCGELNGERFCADKLPTNGACWFVGKHGYVCGGSNQPPPAPNDELPPNPLFPIGVPVKDSNGLPSHGAPPAANGGVPGPGQMPGIVGTYPGPTGSGVDPDGSGNFDTSGLAQESTLQAIKGFIQQIKDSLTGTLTGNGFPGYTAGEHNPTNIDSEIATLRSDISTKLASVKTEYQTLITFGSTGSTGSSLQCPADASFNFAGSIISLCSQDILNNTAGIGQVMIFIAAVVALFILLS